ncbi:MAG: (Fe-S)-binding protein [Candidatus Geothermincolia bacterium]
MAIADYRDDMSGCSRCSSCKWVPFNQIKSWRFAKSCPSIDRFNLQAYSGSGRMIMGLSMLEGRSELNDDVTDIIYRCQMCGACDVACKVYRDDIDLTEVLLELRAQCIDKGQLVIEHMAMVDALKREDNVLGEPKARRGDWADGLPLNNINIEKADVFFHAGCRFSYDSDLRETVRGAAIMLLEDGLTVGVAGAEESCCGGRAYELGYRGEADNYSDDMLSRVKASGASTLVTACADCYAAFNFLYPRMGKDLPCKVEHISQYVSRALSAGGKRLTREVGLTVTYHDPCHLGRMGEPFLCRWHGSKLDRPMSMKRSGRKGEYEAPRALLRSIPGLRFVEMERIREYSWCCGAGGGVVEAYPEYARWTAKERLEEALSTGADAIATACPWCERMFRDTVDELGMAISVFDINDLALMSMGVLEMA